MYGNMYGYPGMNNLSYQQNLQNVINEAQNKLNQVQQQQVQQQGTPTNLTQNFQLAGNQYQNGVKYVGSIDDVKNEFVINDAVFVNKEYTLLWSKKASGEIKSYELKEIIELDKKDAEIAELRAQIEELKEGLLNAKPINEHVDEPVNTTKSSTSKSNKTSNVR